MKISNVIRVASVLVAVAATGLAIHTKVKTEQVKNDTHVDDDIKGETIVRNDKVMKAAVVMAATAGVVFLCTPNTKAIKNRIAKVETFKQELAEHLNVASCELKGRFSDMLPNMKKDGLDDSLSILSTRQDLYDSMTDKIESMYVNLLDKCKDSQKELDDFYNITRASYFAEGLLYSSECVDELIDTFTDGKGLL